MLNSSALHCPDPFQAAIQRPATDCGQARTAVKADSSRRHDAAGC